MKEVKQLLSSSSDCTVDERVAAVRLELRKAQDTNEVACWRVARPAKQLTRPREHWAIAGRSKPVALGWAR